jgi:hypothetical protein
MLVIGCDYPTRGARLLPAGRNPEHRRTGTGGYFAKRESDLESTQRT